jgi:hypothetical protein
LTRGLRGIVRVPRSDTLSCTPSVMVRQLRHGNAVLIDVCGGERCRDGREGFEFEQGPETKRSRPKEAEAEGGSSKERRYMAAVMASPPFEEDYAQGSLRMREGRMRTCQQGLGPD